MKLDFPGILEAVMTHGPLTISVQDKPHGSLVPTLTSANAQSILKLINVLILMDDHFDIFDPEGRSVIGRRIRKENESAKPDSRGHTPHRSRVE